MKKVYRVTCEGRFEIDVVTQAYTEDEAVENVMYDIDGESVGYLDSNYDCEVRNLECTACEIEERW